VVIAKTLTNKGGAVIGGGVGGQVRVIVPRGAAGKSLGVAIIHGSVATVRAEVPTSLRDDKILADFGVELQHGSSPATARKPVTVNFGAPSIRRGEVLVAYDPKTGGFVPVPATFTISLGNVAITTNSSVSLALLEPNK
jgi:hypothetical protein